MPDIREIISRYSVPGDLIPALQEIQKEFGYLSEEHMEELSRKIGVPLTMISGVTTFYTMFKLKPVGKYNLAVCRGTACHVHNSESLLKHLEKKLNIKSGELTKDGKISLESVNCIGACAKAPAIMLNGKVIGELTEDKLDQLIKSLE